MIKAVIVDDEQAAVEGLQTMLSEFCKDVEVVGSANSIIDGIKTIQQTKPNLVFLDIEMPYGNGFDILEAIPEKEFQVIFVTAYDHYAIKAIKYSALDYLLKPVDIDDLESAVEKLRESITNKNFPKYDMLMENVKAKHPLKLALPTLDGFLYIPVEHITRIEANGSYSDVYLDSGEKHIVSRNLRWYEELLDERVFFRAHKSHIINLKHVKKFSRSEGGTVEMEDGSIVEISRRKKDDFQRMMSELQ